MKMYKLVTKNIQTGELIIANQKVDTQYIKNTIFIAMPAEFVSDAENVKTMLETLAKLSEATHNNYIIVPQGTELFLGEVGKRAGTL